jgi:hypothetical protein
MGAWWPGTATVSAGWAYPSADTALKQPPALPPPSCAWHRRLTQHADKHAQPPTTVGSICTMKLNRHCFILQAQFKLVSGADNLSVYTFETKKAQHLFCKCVYACGDTVGARWGSVLAHHARPLGLRAHEFSMPGPQGP